MSDCYEKGEMRILKETMCKHREHMFIWTSAGNNTPPPDDLLCTCGMWRWDSFPKLKETDDGLG